MSGMELLILAISFYAETIEEILPELEVPYLTRPLVYDREEYLKEEVRRKAS